jgi:hypothetical protein
VRLLYQPSAANVFTSYHAAHILTTHSSFVADLLFLYFLCIAFPRCAVTSHLVTLLAYLTESLLRTTLRKSVVQEILCGLYLLNGVPNLIEQTPFHKNVLKYLNNLTLFQTSLDFNKRYVLYIYCDQTTFLWMSIQRKTFLALLLANIRIRVFLKYVNANFTQEFAVSKTQPVFVLLKHRNILNTGTPKCHFSEYIASKTVTTAY